MLRPQGGKRCHQVAQSLAWGGGSRTDLRRWLMEPRGPVEQVEEVRAAQRGGEGCTGLGCESRMAPWGPVNRSCAQSPGRGGGTGQGQITKGLLVRWLRNQDSTQGTVGTK